MTELDKIQREIDDDLRKLGLLPENAADAGQPEADLLVRISSDYGITSEDTTRPITAGPIPSAAKPTPEPTDGEIVAEGFYRETIKHAPFPVKKARMPWRRKLVIACLICTLGTGTLGLGIGSAIVLTDYFWEGGIKTETAGETLTDAAEQDVYDINSVRYVFSGGEGARTASLSDMIALVEPSVVAVSSSFQTEQQTYPGIPGETVGNASGIIFKEDARNVYIATNDHVVRGAATVNVRFTGGVRPVSAVQVGMNREADLAVISVSKRELLMSGVKGIVLASFGDSDLMEMGDTVIAIGNVMGEGNIATQGIISATEKIIPVEGRKLTVLQTDAAINFGSSGGALFNTGGEVIGINSAKLTIYPAEGMGFSISSNIALPILNDLMTTPSKPSLGIYGADLTPTLAAELEIKDVPFAGVYVESIIPGTGAEGAGILAGDIITGFNGEPVFTMAQLKETIRRCAVGETVEVNIIRGGKPVKLNARLTETVVNGFTN